MRTASAEDSEADKAVETVEETGGGGGGRAAQTAVEEAGGR